MSNEKTNQTKNSSKAVQQKKTKRNKIISITAISIIAAILAITVLPKALRPSATATSVTTYVIDAVAYGDVDTTISGSGTLTPITKETIYTEEAITIDAIHYESGKGVLEGNTIITGTNVDGETIEITAPYDCVILEFAVQEGDELTEKSQIAMIMSREGFTMGLAVDEYDIANVEVGQEVTFTIDAVDEECTGTITKVSYNGSTSSSTTAYQLTAKMDWISGVYPGMSATAQIVIESSGEGTLVPVDAVYTSGDDEYLYLAPKGAKEGEEYTQDELDLSDLEKLEVETGMSDGTYIMVDDIELLEGQLIVIIKVTATQTGSQNSSQGGFGGMGGGGNFPGGMGGMDFGDFDFENFNPGNMGGFPGFGG